MENKKLYFVEGERRPLSHVIRAAMSCVRPASSSQKIAGFFEARSNESAIMRIEKNHIDALELSVRIYECKRTNTLLKRKLKEDQMLLARFKEGGKYRKHIILLKAKDVDCKKHEIYIATRIYSHNKNFPRLHGMISR